MIRNDNVRLDYTKSGGGAQEKSEENRRKLEAGIIRQLHKAEERVLEMVYYILLGRGDAGTGDAGSPSQLR